MKQEDAGALGKLDLKVDYGFNFTQANTTIVSTCK